MTERRRDSGLWEFFREPVLAGDSHFVECEADFKVSEITEITSEMLRQLGIKHAFDRLGRNSCLPSS
jgi:hypothetical protein